MREISWLAEDLSASQRGVCSLELVSLLLLSRLFIAEIYFQLRFPSLPTRFTVTDSTATVLTLILKNLLCGFQLVSKASFFFDRREPELQCGFLK
jgi:hypothetical protein